MILFFIIVIITVLTIAIVNIACGKKEWKMTCRKCGMVWYVSKKDYMNQTGKQKLIHDICACPSCKSKDAVKETVKRGK